jgi:hypothetical protein
MGGQIGVGDQGWQQGFRFFFEDRPGIPLFLLSTDVGRCHR